MSVESQVVSFRLSPAQVEVLKGIAATRQVSVGDCARELVIEGLSGEWLASQIATQTRLLLTISKDVAEIGGKVEELFNRVESVEQDTSDTFRHLFELRSHFKKVAFATLDGLWSNMDREDVQAWCDKNLKSDLTVEEGQP